MPLSAALSPSWQYADLRALDPVDASQNTQDLVAAYLRQVGDDLQIRFDFLDLPSQADSDLFVQLEHAQNRVQIAIPASGTAQVFLGEQRKALSDARLRVFRDPLLDTLTVYLYMPALPGELLSGFEVSAWLTEPHSTAHLDELPAVNSDAIPPAPLNVLLAFTDTLPAATPAEALRSWDGAHAGPHGTRHGLRGLLDAVESAHIPLWLLDLKTPPTLSALEALGAIGRLRSLEERGLVILPDSAPLRTSVASAPLVGRALAESRLAGIAYGLGTAPAVFVYPCLSLDAPLSLLSDLLSGSGCLLSYSGYAHFVSPQATAQATANGPASPLRARLVQQATQSGVRFLALGGNLSTSTWGEPRAAAETLRYLANRPWIYFVKASDLPRALPLSPSSLRGQSTPPELAPVQQRALEALSQAPANPLTEAAWQMLFSLLTPTSPGQAALRRPAFGHIGTLLAAAHWAAAPTSISDCQSDVDWDGAPECILASTDTFLAVEMEGGLISLMVILDSAGPHQIIAPTFQFTVGLSDPSLWDPALGVRGDPQAILGAFDEGGGTRFQAKAISSRRLELVTVQGSQQKVYTLMPRGVRAEFEMRSDFQGDIPLGLDGWRRLSPGWSAAFRESKTPNGWRWGLDSLFVEIRTNGILSSQAFTASLPWLALPEDPNFGYPEGHFLPFPLALAHIQGKGNIRVEIEVSPLGPATP